MPADKGKQLAARLCEIALDIQNALLEGMSENDKEAFSYLLGIALNNMNNSSKMQSLLLCSQANRKVPQSRA